jgi:Hemerythrin HHE cation binding domain
MTATTSPTGWPTQLLLPGQAAAPEGPVDMTMMYVMHHAFRRDLTAFAAAAAATPLKDRASWRALAARWDVFATALHHHHSGEDVGLGPLLLERADEAGRQVLTAMEAEHSEIDPILESCAAGFARLAAIANDDARAALVVRLTAGKESLARHLAHEETDAIELIQELMTDAEWRQVEEDHFVPKRLPLSLLLKMMPWMLYEMPAQARRSTLASKPLGLRIVWRLTRPSFERAERRTFRWVSAG